MCECGYKCFNINNACKFDNGLPAWWAFAFPATHLLYNSMLLHCTLFGFGDGGKMIMMTAKRVINWGHLSVMHCDDMAPVVAHLVTAVTLQPPKPVSGLVCHIIRRWITRLEMDGWTIRPLGQLGTPVTTGTPATERDVASDNVIIMTRSMVKYFVVSYTSQNTSRVLTLFVPLVLQASHGLWGSAGSKMPIYAQFLVFCVFSPVK